MRLFEGFPLFDSFTEWERGNQLLYESGLTDGLPVALPTEKKLTEMLGPIVDPEKSYGTMSPGHREVTPANVAYQAVMAGCQPEEFPVVLTAVTAALKPAFNLLGIQTTTGTPTTAVVLHGPIVGRLGANAGENCLGPGNRVNACIGRAVRLALTNIGAAYPGEMDMSTIGQPGKYVCCFAEIAENSMIPPLHVRKGLSSEASAVTLLGISGTVEVFEPSSKADATLKTLAGSMQITANMSGSFQYMGGGEQYILIPPEVVQILKKSGWDLFRMQQYLYNHAAIPKKRFSGEVQKRIEDTTVPIAKSPEHIHFIVAGGIGVKITYAPSWMGGTDSVTLPILDTQ